MFMVILLILNWPFLIFQVLALVVTWAALILTVVSLIDYLVKTKGF